MQVPRIYAIADAARWAPRPLPEVVAELAAAGWPWIQVRDKQASDRELLRIAEACVAAAGDFSRIWINDRADVAAMVGAWGVHLGDEDPPPPALRGVFPQLVTGRTTRDAEGVARADTDAAVDVVAFGPLFATGTKVNAAAPRGIDAFNRVRDLTDKPLIAIGGIEEHAIPDLRWAGANTVAVAGALSVRPSLVVKWVSRYALPATATWPRVFLTGFMASGKTCVGRRLAAALGWQFVDLDTMVSKGAEKSIAQIFAEDGEEEFRRLERRALRTARAEDKAVIACGGGVLESSDNRDELRRDPGVVVWLDAVEAVIAERLSGDAGRSRPLAACDWRRLLADRRPSYQHAAAIEVPVDAPEAVERTTRRVYDHLVLDERMQPQA